MAQVQLNPVQTDCVNHIEGPLLVLAGAGSGKTRVVTHRISHLIDIGVPPSEILGLTFTNKAAEEMQLRVRSQTNQSVLISTFHSLCARILRESIHHLGYETNFTIYDTSDTESLVKNCLATLDIKSEKGLVPSLRSAISRAKNDMLKPKDLPKDGSSQRDKILPDVFARYEELLKNANALDFDDLLVKTIELLEGFPDVLKMYQDRWNFILVDEYQDTNQAQYRLIKALSDVHHNIFVVGDPDQSIYSFRGANVQNILQFEDDFPGGKVITLDQNYRSTEQILEAANSLINHNEGRYEKHLWSDLGEGSPVNTYLASNDREEAEFVIETLYQHMRKHDLSLADVVIFYRVNAQSRVYEDALLRHDIPYKIIGGISFYGRREIKDILSLLRLAVSPYDLISFSRMVNTPKRGLGITSIGKIRDGAEVEGVPILNYCRMCLDGSGMRLSARQRDGVGEFLSVIDKLKAAIESKLPLSDLIVLAIEESRYLTYLKEDPDSFDDRKANLDELINKGAEFEEDNQGGELSLFLEELTLKAAVDDNDSLETVKLMTLHNGKGLEFLLTFMVGMEEDLFPHINTKDTAAGLEEERRLCYVGMTRAKQYLYMSASKFRLIWGTPKFMRPSRFFQEIDPKYIKKDGGFVTYEGDLDAETEFETGSQVKHQSFGIGTVEKCYNTSLGLTLDVHFHNSNSTKTLVAKYAKLVTV